MDINANESRRGEKDKPFLHIALVKEMQHLDINANESRRVVKEKSFFAHWASEREDNIWI